MKGKFSFISFQGGQIYFQETGSGMPVVLLHGFLGSASVFNTVIPHLSSNFRLILIDLPGHGKSDCFGYIHRMEFMARAVNAVLDAINIKKVSIVGHSMGGYVALSLASGFPDRVLSICLLNSITFSDSAEKKIERQRSIEVIKSGHPLFLRQTIQYLFANAYLKENKSALTIAQHIAEKTSIRGILAALEGMKIRLDNRKILGQQKIPVYWFIGKHDAVFPKEIVHRHMKIMGDKFIRKFEKSGHMIMLEEPELLANVLKEIFDSN